MLLSVMVICGVAAGVALFPVMRKMVLFVYHRRRMRSGYFDRIESAVYLLKCGDRKAVDCLLKEVTTQNTTLDGRHRYLTETQYKAAKLLVAIGEVRVIRPLMRIVEDKEFIRNAVYKDRDEFLSRDGGMRSLWASFRHLLRDAGKGKGCDEVVKCVEEAGCVFETLDKERRERESKWNAQGRYYDRNTEHEELRGG